MAPPDTLRDWPTIAVSLATFVALGLPTGAVGITWPSMRVSLGVPLAAVGVLLVVATLAYWASTWATQTVVRRWTFSGSLGGAAVVTAIGLLLLAACTSLWVAIVGVAMVGLGSGVINAGTNAHATVSGGVRRMGLLHASWALGAGASPVLFMASSYLLHSLRAGRGPVRFEEWRIVFLTIALVFLLVAAGWYRRRDGRPLMSVVEELREHTGRFDRRLLVPWIVFAFVVVGLESSIGQWTYSQRAGAGGLASPMVGVVLTSFWLSMMVGRLVLGLGGKWFDRLNRKVATLDWGVLTALVATLVLWALPSGLVAAVALPVIGFSMSILLPVLYKTAPDRLSHGLAARAVFYESTAATLGCALVPAAAGIWLQWRGASSLESFLLFVAVVMTAAHAAGKRLTRPRRWTVQLAHIVAHRP
jgi:fucose permease